MQCVQTLTARKLCKGDGISQPHHSCKREEGKRSAQAGGTPTAEGAKNRSRIAATSARGAGRSPQNPMAVRRDASKVQ